MSSHFSRAYFSRVKVDEVLPRESWLQTQYMSKERCDL